MLEPAVALPGRVQQEHVAVEIVGFAEKLKMLLAERLQVVTQPRHIAARAPAYRDDVRHALCLELANRELADLERVIDELFVVGRGIGAEAIRRGAVAAHRGRHHLANLNGCPA